MANVYAQIRKPASDLHRATLLLISARNHPAPAHPAVRQILHAPRPQTKLTAGAFGREADQVAHPVMRMPAAGTPAKKEPHPCVPTWGTLPDTAKIELKPRGFDEKWFQDHPDKVRLSVLNLYVKLKAVGLWHFVEHDAGSDSASLTFTASDDFRLKAALTARKDFGSPERKSDSWSSREYRSDAALHLKHFPGDPIDQVQAHIDGKGLLPIEPVLARALPLVIRFIPQALSHLYYYYSYQDPFFIRTLLLAQGGDRATLLGLDCQSGPSSRAERSDR